MSKRTFQPNNRRRAKVHGFRLRMHARRPRDPGRPPSQGPHRAVGLSAAQVLPQRHRMRRSTDFADAIRSGSRAAGRHLAVHLLVHTSADVTPTGPVRVGFVVSKAVGGAVQRNLVKRRLREIVSHSLSDLPDGALAVVRAFPSSASASYAELRDDVARSIEVAIRRQTRPAAEQSDRS